MSDVLTVQRRQSWLSKEKLRSLPVPFPDIWWFSFSLEWLKGVFAIDVNQFSVIFDSVPLQPLLALRKVSPKVDASFCSIL